MNFFFWNFFLFLNSFLILKKLRKGFSLLHFLILYCFQIAIVFTILGGFHLLYPLYITISFLSIFLILIFTKKERINLKFPDIPFYNSSILLVVISCYALSIYFQSFLPPLTTDGLLYHLPFAIHYYKTHSLSLPPIFFSDIAMTYYPFVGDIFYLFAIFSNNESLLNFVQIPFMVIGAISVYLLMKKNNFSERLSIAGACLFSLLKPVFKESSLCFVDLIMASMFLASLYFFSSGKKEDLFFGFLSSSILIGTKNLGIIYFFFLLPFIFKNFKREFKIPLFAGFLFFIITGLSGYIRNFIITKNPFFPATISIGKFRIFPGIYLYLDGNLFSHIKKVFLLFLKPVSHIDPSGPISFFLFFFLFLSIIISRKESFYFKYILFLPIICVFSYSLILPEYYYQIRHLLPIYGIFPLGIFYPFKRFEKYSHLSFLFLFPVLLDSISPRIIVYIIIILFFTESLMFFSYKAGRIREFFIFLIIIFSVFFLFHFKVLEKKYSFLKYRLWKSFYKEEGELWEFVQKNSKDGKNIAYVGSFLLYPFYGDNYQNNVYYQSVNSVKTKLIHLYPKKEILFPLESPEILYRKNPSFNIWLKGLEEKDTDWIIIRKGKEFIEKFWIEKNPDLFTLLFSNNYAEIYILKIGNKCYDYKKGGKG